MKKKSILRHIQEQGTSLLNKYKNKRVSIRTKVFFLVGLFVILNILINFIVVKLSINDIYLWLEKRELKREYYHVKRNYKDEDKLVNVIYNANDRGIKVKVFDSDYNLTYSILNEQTRSKFTSLDLILLDSLKDKESEIIILKNYYENGYDLHLVGKIDDNYTIISSSIESLKKDASTTLVIILLTSVITFLILLIISYFISKLFGRKIDEIKDVTDDISNMRFDKKISINSNDELGDLFNNVNKMSDKLEETIKELEEANYKLKQDLIEKEKQETARKKLIANISHEFKTPLTIISGYGQLLKDEVKGKENKENVDLIISESERLSDLVYEFLELSKLESGNIKLNKEKFNAKDVIEEELKKLNVKLVNSNITVKKSIRDYKEVYLDKKQFTKVVENILTNAIKFCKYDKVIKIDTYIKDNYFYYDVFNTGDNISDKNLENIFNSYYKDKSSRNKKGTGLGLTITRAIVDLHEGNCKVINKDDGVLFSISFKL